MTPTALAYKLFTHHFGDRLVGIEMANVPERPTHAVLIEGAGSSGKIVPAGAPSVPAGAAPLKLPKLEAEASRDARGNVYVLVINQDATDAVAANVQIAGLAGQGQAEIQTLSGPAFSAFNTPQNPDAVQTALRPSPSATDRSAINSRPTRSQPSSSRRLSPPTRRRERHDNKHSQPGRRGPVFWEWRFRIFGHALNKSPILAVREGNRWLRPVGRRGGKRGSMAEGKMGRRSVLRKGWVLMAAAAGGDVFAAEEMAFPAEWPAHPRLIVRPDDWATLRQARARDPELEALVGAIVVQARAGLDDAPLVRKLEGRRLLGVSRSAVARVLLAAFAFRVTGEKAFRDRAEADLLAAAGFSDWNPSHFLDVAEMTTALALGYDWLFDDLTPAARAAVRAAIVEKGLKPGADPARNSWYRSHNNWNQVCLGGMAMGALAVAEDEPDLARRILRQVPEYNRNGLEPYRPDGIYPEGPGYWAYGTTYQMLLIEALRSALGSDLGLLRSPGLLESGDFVLHVTGPSGRYFNFADGGERLSTDPAVFRMAGLRGVPRMAALPERFLRERLKTGRDLDRFLPLIAFWRPPAQSGPGAAEPPLHWSGRGPNSIAVWRSSWTDPGARWLAIKAGGAAVSHGHMDGGAFVLEWDGVRWAVDLGAQSYHSLEKIGIKLWDSSQDGERWKVFRLNSFSHNTLTLDGSLHNAKGLARLVEARPDGAVIDLLPVLLPGQATGARRRVRVEDDAIVLEDELEGLRPGTPVRWAMATEARIRLDGSRAHLEQDGKSLLAAFAPAALRLEDISIERPEGDWNAPNPGRRMLAAHGVADAGGRLRIEARFTRGVRPAPLKTDPTSQEKPSTSRKPRNGARESSRCRDLPALPMPGERWRGWRSPPPWDDGCYWAAFQRYDPMGKTGGDWPNGTNRVQPLRIPDFRDLVPGGIFCCCASKTASIWSCCR